MTPPPQLRELFSKYPGVEFGEETYGDIQILKYDDTTRLTVGKFCSFATGVQVALGGEHRLDWTTTFPFPALWPEATSIEGHPASRGDITIGNDVWLGANVLVLSGASIGDGAVISAGSVVSGSVVPYAVFGGNPGRFLRWRFSEAVREKLLAIRWWDWSRERIVQWLPLLLNPDVQSFITAVEEDAHDQI